MFNLLLVLLISHKITEPSAQIPTFGLGFLEKNKERSQNNRAFRSNPNGLLLINLRA